MLFQRELNEIAQRQLALRLRHIELRADLGSASRDLLQPLHVVQGLMGSGTASRASLWGGLGVLGVGLGLLLGRRATGSSRGGAALEWLRLGLRIARLWVTAKAETTRRAGAAEASSAKASVSEAQL